MLRIGGNVINKTRNRSPADTEVIAVLYAISHVSARLAREPLDPCRRQTTIGRKQDVEGLNEF